VDEQQRSPGGTLRFEGADYGSGVSLFLVENAPGEGPNLHKHPYSETWIVRGGNVRFTADGVELDAGAGDIVVVGPDTPHKFENVGTGRLDMVCIHASPRMIQIELE
jgi:mannose-6-phosphate isomerase-like protein (cupin superfamily)